MSSKLLDTIFKKLDNTNTDLNIVGEMAWLLTYFTYNGHTCKKLIDRQFLQHLVCWICKVRPHQQEYLFVVTPMLRCLGRCLF